MATKAEIIAALSAAGIGEEHTIGKTVAQLQLLAEENGVSLGEVKEPVRASGRSEDDPRTGRLVKCRIEYSTDPGGREDAYGSVNGFNVVAKRGQEIELDEGFVKHFEGIVITDVEAQRDANGKETGALLEVNRKRFQVSRID